MYERRQAATTDMRSLILKHIYKTGIEFQYENENFQVQVIKHLLQRDIFELLN